MAERVDTGPVERGSLEPHVRTYSGMIGMFKWGGVGVAVIVMLVIWLIAR